MGMDAVLRSFANLCDDPVAWAVIAALAAKTAYSLIWFRICPIVNGGRKDIDPDYARRLVDSPTRHSPRFLLAMLAGLALAIGGLYGLPSPDYGKLALAAMIVGVFVLVVEPSLLSIEDNQLRVVAALAEGDESHALARDRLRYAHLERVGLELGLTLFVTTVILIY